MTKYHINPNTGRANICKAMVKNCPVGGEHYFSKEEAYISIAEEAKNSNPTLMSLSKDLKNNLEEKEKLEAMAKEIKRMTQSDYEGLHRSELNDLANELAHIYGSNKTWKFNENTVEVLKNLQKKKNSSINNIMEKMDAENSNERLSREFEALNKDYRKSSINNYLKRSGDSNAVDVRYEIRYENTIEEIAPMGTKLLNKEKATIYTVYYTDGDYLYMKNEHGQEKFIANGKAKEFLDEYSIVSKPEIYSPEIQYFKNRIPRGSLIEIRKHIKLDEDEENGKRKFFERSNDKKNYGQHISTNERVKILENDGSYIKFEYLEGDKNGESEILLRNEFKNNYTIMKDIYISQYKSQKELEKETKEKFTTDNRVELYSNVGNGVFKGKIWSNDGRDVVFRSEDGSYVRISGKDLDGYGEWSYILKDSSENAYNNSSQSNGNGTIDSSQYTPPPLKTNPYTGEVGVDAVDIRNNFTPINPKEFSKTPLKPNDTVVIADGEGYIYSGYSKVLNKDNGEFAFQNITNGDMQPTIWSSDFIEENNMTVYKMK